MANDNYNIKPIETLQNVGGLSPVGQRKKRKRKQNLNKQGREEQDKPTKEKPDDKTFKNQDNQHSIDYRA